MENRVKLISSLVVTLLVVSLGFAAFSPPALASRAQVLFTDVNGTPVDSWKVGDTLFVTVIDPDENRDSDEVELIGGPGDKWFVQDELGNSNPVIEILVNNPRVLDSESSRPEGLPLLLQETGANTGVFRSQFGLRIVKATADQPAAKNDGRISVQDGDTLFVRYQDPSDPTDVVIDLAKLVEVKATIAITDRAGTPAELWNVGNDIFITLNDADENTDPVTIDTVEGVVLERARPNEDGTMEREILTLVETGPDTGVFMNPDGITLTDQFGTTLQSDLRLDVRDKDTIVVYYRVPGVGAAPPPPPPGTRTDSAENALIKFERTVPVSIRPGETFTVTVKVTAKTALDLAAFSDELPAGFTLVSGDLTAFDSDLSSGDTLTATYQVRAGATAGTFNITGTARAIPTDGASQTVDLTSPLTVEAAAASAGVRASSTTFGFNLSPQRVDTKENNLVKATRELPDTVAPGETFTVTVTVEAKQALELAAVTALLPGDFQLVSGSLTAFEQNMAAGDLFTNTYTVRAGDAPGTFTIDGAIRAKPVGAASQVLTFPSSITVGEVPPAVGFGEGDVNDPHDFALDTAKIAELNPATVTFTDVSGIEKTEFKVTEEVHITVRDEDEDFSSDRVDKVRVMLFDTNGGREELFLLETGVSTGVFRNPDRIRILPINDPDCADEAQGQDTPGILCVHNNDTIYVRYADDLFETLDPFDIAFTTATIFSTETFTEDGGNKLAFVNDQGNPIDRIIKGRQVFVRLEDPDQNESSDVVDKVTVTVLDRDTGDREEVLLEETGPDTGVFQSRQGLTLERPVDGVKPGDGILQMEDRDTIEAYYLDPTNPNDFTAAMLRISPQPGGVVTTPSRTRFTDSAGRDVTAYTVGDNVFVTVDDQDENRTPGTKDVIRGAVTLENVRTGQQLTLDLTETEPDSGIFISGAVSTGAPGSGAELEVEPGDMLRASYTDPNDPADTSEDTAQVETGILEVEKFLNAPNPFSTQTAFTIVGTGIERIQVQVWDLSGRLVFDGEASGSKLNWGGTDNAGDRLANGVYLYQIVAVGRDATEASGIRKLVILR